MNIQVSILMRFFNIYLPHWKHALIDWSNSSLRVSLFWVKQCINCLRKASRTRVIAGKHGSIFIWGHLGVIDACLICWIWPDYVDQEEEVLGRCWQLPQRVQTSSAKWVMTSCRMNIGAHTPTRHQYDSHMCLCTCTTKQNKCMVTSVRECSCTFECWIHTSSSKAQIIHTWKLFSVLPCTHIFNVAIML